ncbi:aldo/keto reductase [Haloarcula japonica]|uniref:Aldo/keto reductase n=1 Tax=Haloarcula japonica (strain ATCC 49778 / DSM 6131 / JCM 7785 / NBRC 101032 / NCIMB 13157 / TR-1) TaxID=1227453 RepID=M0L7E7_HALJT|nr:aldo/keto reductase [Haloarcula japonica]EMA28399.1 aldo/keto reductase [Haloarcula japonica DSM 6131]
MSELPAIGLGTWQNTDPEVCAESVRTALEMGYQHIDTAQYYGNEEAVGEGIASADVPREDVFVGSKVHAEKFGLAHDEVIEGLEVTLDRLGLDSLDLLYVHWPVGNYDAAETMPAFDELVDRGLIDHVGVCNFSTELLDEAMDHLESPLFAHQAETHPLLQQDELVEHAREHDYYHVAYSPLARGDVFDIPEVEAIAEKHDVSAPQVSLAWLLGRENVRTVPKATSEAHIRDNFGALDLELDDEDIERIESIERTERYVERDGAPWLED